VNWQSRGEWVGKGGLSVDVRLEKEADAMDVGLEKCGQSARGRSGVA
jgi:hypothetical protein